MAIGSYSPQPFWTGFDDNGDPLAAGLLYTVTAGGAFPGDALATYSDVGLTTANANPIVLDSAGRATIFLLPSSYKFILKNAAGATIATRDNISAVPPLNSDLDLPGVAGEILAANEYAYLSTGAGSKTAGRWYKADADLLYASLTTQTGFVQAAAAAGAAVTIRAAGRHTGMSGLTIGAPYFVSGTAGAITITPPARRRLVGQADTTTSIVFAADPDLSGVLNVLDYGATGDGTTNDRAAIQAAIDAASLTVAGVVFFPNGNYRVEKVGGQIYSLRLTKAIHLIGASAAGVTIRGHGMGASDLVIDIAGTVNPDLEQVHLSDLTVMSNDAGRPDLINVNRASTCRFTNLNLRDGRHGITFTGNRTFSQTCTNVVCETHLTGQAIRFDTSVAGGQFTFSDCTFNGLIGIGIAGASVSLDSLVFNNCNWEACDQVASVTTTGAVRGVVFNGGRCEKNLGPFDFSPGAAGTVLGLVFNGLLFETDVENYAINVSGTGSVAGLIVQGCYAKDYAQYFVRLIDGEGGQILGNVLEAVPAVVNDYSRAGMVVLNNRDQTGAALGPQWMTSWTTPTFAAGNFTASGAMTWTVASGDVQVYAYSVIGKVMTVLLRINTTTVAGVVNNQLIIAIPGGYVSTKSAYNLGWVIDSGAARALATISVSTAGTTIVCERFDAANFTAAVDTTYVFGQITFEINTP